MKLIRIHRVLKFKQSNWLKEYIDFNTEKIMNSKMPLKSCSVLTLSKPIYVGFTVLELSKLFMHKFHYEYVCNKFDAKLLLTDTGSLVYEIKDKDVYEECFKDRELFDFSGYPKDSKYYDSANKKVPGKMKDEFND